MVQNKPNQAEALNASRNYVERIRNQQQSQGESSMYNNSNIVGQSQNQVSSYRRKRHVKRKARKSRDEEQTVEVQSEEQDRLIPKPKIVLRSVKPDNEKNE